MKINLEKPYSDKWKNGYLVVNPEGRKTVILFNSRYNRSSVSYARYLMSVHLGYEIPSEYEVDHINNDKTDDRIENLQLLTPQENLKKQTQWYIDNVQIRHTLQCPFCGNTFTVTDAYLKGKINQGQKNLFCSRSCNSKYHIATNRMPVPACLPEEDIQRIKELRQQGLSSYKISELTGFARNTVMKYW